MNRPTLTARHRGILARARVGACLCACVLALVGCGTTPPSRFYSLEPLPEAVRSAGDTGGLSVNVGPVMIPEGLDRPQMITRLGPNELSIHDYDRWSEAAGGEHRPGAHRGSLGAARAARRSAPCRTPRRASRAGASPSNCCVSRPARTSNATLVARWRLCRPGEDVPFTTRKSALVAPLPAHDGAAIAAAMSANVARWRKTSPRRCRAAEPPRRAGLRKPGACRIKSKRIVSKWAVPSPRPRRSPPPHREGSASRSDGDRHRCRRRRAEARAPALG